MSDDKEIITSGLMNNIFEELITSMNNLLKARQEQLTDIEKQLGVHPHHRTDDNKLKEASE